MPVPAFCESACMCWRTQLLLPVPRSGLIQAPETPWQPPAGTGPPMAASQRFPSVSGTSSPWGGTGSPCGGTGSPSYGGSPMGMDMRRTSFDMPELKNHLYQPYGSGKLQPSEDEAGSCVSDGKVRPLPRPCPLPPAPSPCPLPPCPLPTLAPLPLAPSPFAPSPYSHPFPHHFHGMLSSLALPPAARMELGLLVDADSYGKGEGLFAWCGVVWCGRARWGRLWTWRARAASPTHP